MHNSNNSEELNKNACEQSCLRAFFTKSSDICRDIYDTACDSPVGPVIKKIDKKFIKFLFVGALNTLFGYSLYALCLFTFTHLPHTPDIIAAIKKFAGFLNLNKETLSLTIQWVVGVLWNFQTTGKIVFKNKNNGLLFKFLLTYIVSYFVNKVLLEMLLHYGLNGYAAQALIVLPVAVFSFIMLKTFVFNAQPK